jgi:hypothetical protein
MFGVRIGLSKALQIPFVDAEDDARSIIIIDLYLEALHLSVQRGYSDIQTQQLLLLLHGTFADVTSIAQVGGNSGVFLSENDEEALEGLVARRLVTRLMRLVKSIPREVLEDRTTVVTIAEEVPDPGALAALESKKPDSAKGNKKAMASYEDALKSLPRVTVKRSVEKTARAVTTISAGPFFPFDEVAHIVKLFTDTLFTHWRLYRYVMQEPRSQTVTEFSLGVQDVPRSTLPALKFALSKKQYDDRQRIREFMSSVEENYLNEYIVEVEQPVEQLKVQWDRVLNEWKQRVADAQRQDFEGRMSCAEYSRAVEVLSRRVSKKSALNTDLSYIPVVAQAVQPVAAPATAKVKSSLVPVAPAPPVSSPTPVPFSIHDMEERIERIAEYLNRSPAGVPGRKK